MYRNITRRITALYTTNNHLNNILYHFSLLKYETYENKILISSKNVIKR